MRRRRITLQGSFTWSSLVTPCGAGLFAIVHNTIWTFKLAALLYKSYYALRGFRPHLIADAATAVTSHDCEGVTFSLDPPLRFHPRPDNPNKSNINKY